MRRVHQAQQASSRMPEPVLSDDPLWYKDAVVYQLHVKSFFDANDDGIGDFAGLIQKLDYIASLGVNTIWLLPFYPSPLRDDGYDVAEYRAVHPDYGPMSDARRFIQEAHRRGLRVVTELVINHTSDQHPWFQRARRAKLGSAARDFYVWSDDDRRYDGTRIIFVDTEPSNWTWDPVAQAYYWHRFYSHQPDLNFDNPKVIDAVLGAMRFWLELGVDGLRLDAVPYLVERDGTNNENLQETHAVLKRLRAEVDAAFPGRMLLAEANQWPEDVQHYFGGDANGLGDECHMAFHFPLMPRMYMAIAQEDRFPITDILRQTPDIPPNCQWAIFLRNHDELTLEMVTDRERDYLWQTYASDRRARLNIGIRRRLTPLVERDRRRIELLNSLLLSMPGTPVIYYGDEIGMGDNIYLGDRDGVRTPMQWSPDRNGGFSRADPARLVLPPIMDPLYGHQAINVEAQAHDPHSLLNWMRRMLSIRRRCRAFGRGTLKLLYPPNRRVLAYLRQHDASAETGEPQLVLCVANLSGAAQAVELNLAAYAGRVPVEMVGGSAFPPIGQLPYLLTLPPHGFFWFMLADAASMPDWYTSPPEPLPEYITLVSRDGLSSLLDDATRQRLEHDVLPTYLGLRRWFAAKSAELQSVRIDRISPLPHPRTGLLLAELVVESDSAERYLLPLGLLPEDDVITALPQQLALARVRQGRQIHLLTDAITIDAFAHLLYAWIGEDHRVESGNGELQFVPTPQWSEHVVTENAEVRRLAVEQSNTSLIIGDRIMLKLFRRLAEGIHPEAEMGRALTAAGYAHVAPLLGEVVRTDAAGDRYVIAIAQGFVHSQGDAWNWMQAALQRVVREGGGSEPASAAGAVGEVRAELRAFSEILGRRLAEMHACLAAISDDPAFTRESLDTASCDALAQTVLERFDTACDRLERLIESGSADLEVGTLARAILHRRHALQGVIPQLAMRAEGSLLIRIHGDLHLGQVLVAQGDACFVDFEGEPTRSLAQRRAKAPPLRDVAGLLRSFAYTAVRPLQDGQVPAATAALLQEICDDCAQCCLSTYLIASAEMPHQWQDAEAPAQVLDLLLIERAAHEVDYEASNRPDWLTLPLKGLLALADRVLTGGAHGP